VRPRLDSRGASRCVSPVRVLALAFAVLAAAVLLAAATTVLAYRRAGRRGRAAAPACPGEREEPLAPATLAVVVAQEALATAIVLLAAPLAMVGGRRLRGNPRRPLLLIPGTLPLWLPLLPLARALRRDGWTVVRGPRTTRRGAPGAAARLARAIARARVAGEGAAVTLVAHGAGGLAARRLLEAAGPDAGVVRLVTLGTPHAATAAGSAAPGVDITAVFSVEDARVDPAAAYWRGVPNVQVRAVGHWALLFAPLVRDLVREALAGDVTRAAAAGS
jgi:hypothetical protein